MAKRIVLLTYSYWPPDFGGELLASIERLKGLAHVGFDVQVLTSGSPSLAAFSIDEGLHIYRSLTVGTGRGGRILRLIWFILWASWKLLVMPAFDIVHFGSLPAIGPVSSALLSGWYCFLSHMRGARTVLAHSLADTEHSALETLGWRGFWRRIEFFFADVIVAVSPALFESVARIFPQKTVLIPYGVRDELFVPLADDDHMMFRSQSGCTAENVVFVFLGTIGQRKGFDLLAHAFSNLASVHPNWRLWVVGPRTHKESQNVDESDVALVTRPLEGLDGSVHWWGRINDRHQSRKILASADVFVFPTRKEGMPIAPMEAMAVGIPVIISRIPGVTDLANVEGETGLFVPVDDVVSLQAAMERLGNDPLLRHSLGEKATQRINEGFGWKSYLERWANLYTEAMRS